MVIILSTISMTNTIKITSNMIKTIDIFDIKNELVAICNEYFIESNQTTA